METNKRINKVLAFEVRKERRIRDLTQENMAEELKMSQSKYNKLERNLMPLSIDEWSRVLSYFGFKLSEVLTRNGF